MTSAMVTGAELVDDVDEPYWLGGLWDDAGRLVWSSAPRSYETEEAALNGAETALQILQKAQP